MGRHDRAIIPVKPGGNADEWWQQVVLLARADSAVNADVDPEDAAAVCREAWSSTSTGRQQGCSCAPARITVWPSVKAQKSGPAVVYRRTRLDLRRLDRRLAERHVGNG